MSDWYYHERYLQRKWTMMRTEMEWDEKPLKETEESKETDKTDQKEQKIEEFEELYRQYEESDNKASNVTVTDIETGEEVPMERWVPYKGSRGGKGWKNTRTGNIKYQLEKPTSKEPTIMDDEIKDVSE